jgi:hypothetical protein
MKVSIYNKFLIRKYFNRLKYAKRVREQIEEMKIDNFEEMCFNDEEWNYLI